MPQFLSEHQKRIKLLGFLGWRIGQPLTEYAKVVRTFWFGSNNGVPFVQRSPLDVPSRKIAEFIVHYAPSRLISSEIRQSIQQEFRV